MGRLEVARSKGRAIGCPNSATIGAQHGWVGRKFGPIRMENKIMTKVVLNSCYGGFSLSLAAIKRYDEIKGLGLTVGLYDDTWTTLNGKNWSARYLDRDDPALVQVVEELGPVANGACAKLRIETIPPGAHYRIREDCGVEHTELRDEINWRIG